MSHENPETAKIFLNLEDAPESGYNAGGGGGGDGFEQNQPQMPMRPVAMNSSSSSVASGPALVALIAILGGGSIFGMRVVSKHAAIAAENFVLDYQESSVGKDFDSRFEATMLNLERSTRPVQVPIAYLPRDPFNFGGQTVFTPVAVTPTEDPKTAAEREEARKRALAAALQAERQRQEQAAMTKALGGYQLQSTLQGSNPVARISGEIYRVGGQMHYEITRGSDQPADTGTFTIESIGGRTVTLLAPDGTRYELSIGMPFRELEPAVTEEAETPAEETQAESKPVDEFAAAAAAAAGGSEAKPTETQPAEKPATTEGAKTEGETPAANGTESSFMERLKAASEALKQSQAEQAKSAEGENAEGDTTEESAETAEDSAEEATSEETADEATDESGTDDEAAESEDGSTEEATEESDDNASEDDESGDDESADDGESEGDEGGR